MLHYVTKDSLHSLGMCSGAAVGCLDPSIGSTLIPMVVALLRSLDPSMDSIPTTLCRRSLLWWEYGS